ncbi:MAG: YeeE/YedE family protein [Clostridia bacterium]|nr:YeeE/YedE family protein [Clostridia bacterium]
MSTYLIPGLLGLLAGLILHWGRLTRSAGLRDALGLRRSLPLRTCLTALGWGVLMTALLMWLAVIDVDTVSVLPLSPGVLLGGLVFGISAGVCGFTPTTAFAGLGAGNAPEALCTLVGCALVAWLPVEELFRPLREPWLQSTLFEVTLDEPWLFKGGFLGMLCLGALPVVWAICVPSPRTKVTILSDEAVAERAARTPIPPAEEPAPAPESAAEETVVAALEGEEPLVIDMGLDAEADAAGQTEEAAPDDDSPAEDEDESPA